MLQSSKMPRRIVAAIALSLSTIAMIAPSAPAVPGSASYPDRPYSDVPIASIASTGWTQCWSDLYGVTEPASNLTSACTGTYILLAGGPVGADTYTVAAAGERTAVFGVTGSNVTTLNNGTYWYFNPSASMGFAPISSISQSSADTFDASYSPSGNTGPWRMSWHRSGSNINGGWRAGLVTWLNSSTDYVRVAYMANSVYSSTWAGGLPFGRERVPLAPPIPQLLVDAMNTSVDAGQPVPADYRVLGLRSADTVTDVVLEYAGTSVWGDVFGPSTTPPTAPGSYSVSVKSYKLTSSDPTYYNGQYKHSAVLTIRWVPTPITDAALAGLPTSNAVAPKYTAKGASVTGDTWTVAVNGAPVSAAGGKLLTDPGAVLAVSGTGFRPYSAVRVFLTPAELGSVWTDAAGHFSKSVTVPNTAAGAQNLQVNGYSRRVRFVP